MDQGYGELDFVFTTGELLIASLSAKIDIGSGGANDGEGGEPEDEARQPARQPGDELSEEQEPVAARKKADTAKKKANAAQKAQAAADKKEAGPKKSKPPVVEIPSGSDDEDISAPHRGRHHVPNVVNAH
jgi:hypothetical protein